MEGRRALWNGALDELSRALAAQPWVPEPARHDLEQDVTREPQSS